jgi:antitoxin Phd
VRKRRNRPHHDQGRDASPARALIRYPGWKLEDAKAHFSEVVRRAQSEGPQRVTVRGKDTAVVISTAKLERLLPQETKIPFVDFMESLYVEGFNLSRETDYGRDIEVIDWLLDTNVISTIINPRRANRKGLGGNAERKRVIS